MGNATLIVNLIGAAPQNLRASVFSSTVITVFWDPPEGSLGNSLQFYSIKYGVKDLSEREVLNISALFQTFEGLEEFTEYKFEIKGIYSNDVVGTSVFISEFTEEDGKYS